MGIGIGVAIGFLECRNDVLTWPARGDSGIARRRGDAEKSENSRMRILIGERR